MVTGTNMLIKNVYSFKVLTDEYYSRHLETGYGSRGLRNLNEV